MNLKLRVSPDGKTVEGLYSDKFPWRNIGDVCVRRATDVYFDNEIGQWRIRILRVAPGILHTSYDLEETFDTRTEALDFEIEYLQAENDKIRCIGCDRKRAGSS